MVNLSVILISRVRCNRHLVYWEKDSAQQSLHPWGVGIAAGSLKGKSCSWIHHLGSRLIMIMRGLTEKAHRKAAKCFQVGQNYCSPFCTFSHNDRRNYLLASCTKELWHGACGNSCLLLSAPFPHPCFLQLPAAVWLCLWLCSVYLWLSVSF